MSRITIHAEVDKPTKVAIQKLAKDNKVSTSVIVRWALDSYLTAISIGQKAKESATATT